MWGNLYLHFESLIFVFVIVVVTYVFLWLVLFLLEYMSLDIYARLIILINEINT